MSQGFYGFPNILGLLRATSVKVLGKAGATAGCALAGATTSGAPTSGGPFDVGDMVVGQNGTLWICTAGGTSQSSPGTFVQAGGTSPLTTKGDLWVYGSADTRLGVGTDGYAVVADSTQSTGLAYKAFGSAPSNTTVQLDYSAATDLMNNTAIAATTWTDLSPNQTFSVDNASSVVEIAVCGCCLLGATATGTQNNSASRLIIDSAGTPTTKMLGGGYSPPVTGGVTYCNVLAGSDTVCVSGLGAGSHTVKAQIYSNVAGSAFCRASTQPNLESLSIRVLERKQSSANTLPALATKTSNYTLTTSDTMVIASAGSLTLVLPSAASAGAGRLFVVKNGNVTGTTVARSGSDTLDGATSYSLASAYNQATFVADGTSAYYVLV